MIKYYRIAYISIPIAFFLSGCTMGQKTRISTQLTAPLPLYVKHNQRLESVKQRKALATSTPFITVQLVRENDNVGHVRYIITDKFGVPGAAHSQDSHDINESKDSTLFTTKFPLDRDFAVKPNNKEVIIQGTATDGRCHAWRSDCTDGSSMNNSDVRWKNWRCK